ncbi:MAG: cell division protein FtsL [Deltaproteobacteria bacterium]|nr:cell division protein FtsL [Deltaproteobacteria bacterium]
MKQRKTILFALVAAIGLVAIGTRKIAGEHQRIRLGYELTSARAELRAVEEENRRLRLEYSLLVSPERIRPLATALGMRIAGPGELRVVDDEPKTAHRGGGK